MTSANRRNTARKRRNRPDKNVGKDDVNEYDISGMKHWIESLTFESFTSALEFTFKIDGEGDCRRDLDGSHLGFRRHASSKIRPLPASLRKTAAREHSMVSSTASHEYDLLMEMTALKCPPQTPDIFLSGGSYDYESSQFHNSAWGHEPLDICDETGYCYEWRRAMKGRLESPCWFRWLDLESKKNPSFHDHFFFNNDEKIGSAERKEIETRSGKRSDKRRDKRKLNNHSGLSHTREAEVNRPSTCIAAGNNMPPELLDVLDKAGVKRSTSSLLKSYNEAELIDRNSESFGKNYSAGVGTGDTSKFDKKFRIEARRCSGANALIADLGITQAQHEADKSLLLLTSIVWDRRLSSSLEQNNPRGEYRDNSALLSSLELLPRCRLDASEKPQNPERIKKYFLDALRVASRGNFLSVAGKRKETYLAPWFNPTEQWFSLSMYLSSRFEAALWEKYFSVHDKISLNDQTAKACLIKSVRNLEKDAFDRVVMFALHMVAKEDLIRKVGLINGFLKSNDKRRALPFGFFRNSSLYGIFIMKDAGDMSTLLPSMDLSEEFFSAGEGKVLEKLTTSPLLEWGSTLSEFKTMVLYHLQEGLAREAERALIESLEEGSGEMPNRGRHNNTGSGAKIKKKKKKRVQKRRHDSKQRTLSTNTIQVEKLKSEERRSSDEDEPIVESILPSCFPGNDLQHNELGPSPAIVSNDLKNTKNRATVSVLRVIDEILCNVFTAVGLDGNVESDAFAEAKAIKCREEHNETEKLVETSTLENQFPTRKTAATSLKDRKASKFGSNADSAIPTSRRDDVITSQLAPSMPSQQNKSSITKLRETHSLDSNMQIKRSFKDKMPPQPPVSIYSEPPHQSELLRNSLPVGENSTSGKKPLSGSMEGSPQSNKLYQKGPPQCNHPNVSSFMKAEDEACWPSSDFSPLFPQVTKDEISIFDGAPLCLSGALDGWNSVASPQQEETSIISDLLEKKHRCTNSDSNQMAIASSTAASIASSRVSGGDPGLDIDGDSDSIPFLEQDQNLISDGSASMNDANKSVHFKKVSVQMVEVQQNSIVCRNRTSDVLAEPSSYQLSVSDTTNADASPTKSHRSPINCVSSDLPHSSDHSPTPLAPPTPPPQLSPILVSLADLGKLRKEAASGEYSTSRGAEVISSNAMSSGSLPGSPVFATAPCSLTPSWSRDDLRSYGERRKPPRRDRDEHQSMGYRQVDALLSYRNVVAQSLPRKPSSISSNDGKQKHKDDVHVAMIRNIKVTKSGFRTSGPDFPNLSSSVTSLPSSKEPIINKILHLDVACARSESALEAAEDASHCNVIPRAQTDDTMTKDGATTITSVHTPPESEQIATLKEERNSYRDICLTLGAENAKLRNLLASQTCTSYYHPASYTPENMTPYFYRNSPYNFQLNPLHAGVFPNLTTQPIVAMSDAGAHRGDFDSSAISEDDTDAHPNAVSNSENQNSVSWQAHGDSVHSFGRRTSGGGTYAESDISLDHNPGGQEPHAFSGFRHVNHQDSFFGPMPLHGMESRLSKDINCFMQALKTQLKKNEQRRAWAVDQITKTVNAVWPRAQIKLYGSHVTKLCLPSSDMDFIICLPAVHKNAPAAAPGDLEGRNAINETNQKVLARKLKGESWLDQRSIKVIERTAVPVIKVSTKDTRSRVVQLDLSFDAKEHHGLEALDMIQHVLEDIPMIRPLVLVLKQFLLDRGLLTAYTGGLSSYCLFLMVTRYCQEQSTAWNDYGSLLMGLLDFYGNFFDPRTTGISVRTGQYFSRSYYAQVTPSYSTQHISEAQGWGTSHQYQFPDLTKRNSFNEKNHNNVNKLGTKPPRFQPLHRQSSFQNTHQPHLSQHTKQQPDLTRSFQSGKPYTFDPVWVEDPLNPGNNVGRNAFRIFQVQRAFSDAHRALVAALEWDINSTNEFGENGEYPLLKCLLQNEDVFFALDDQIHR